MTRLARRLLVLVVASSCADDPSAPPEDASAGSPDLGPDLSYPSDGGDTSCGRAAALACGESKTGSNVGGANWIDRYGCATAPNSGPESYYAFSTREAQVVTVDLIPAGGAQDLDLFVLGESCDAASCLDRSLGVGGQSEQVRFVAESDAHYRVVVDGYLGELGVGAGDYEILTSCATARCTPSAATLNCGATALPGHNGQAGSTDRHDRYGCGEDVTAREFIYRFAPSFDGEVSVALHAVEAWRDLDLFVLEDRGEGCDVSACIASSTTRFDEVASFAAVAGTTYYVAVDGVADRDLGAYTLSVTCPAPDGGVSDAPSD